MQSPSLSMGFSHHNMGFLLLLHACHRCMQSESRTCVICSAVSLVITSNSRHHMPAIIINSLLFGLASSCFRERSLNTQVVGNKYVLHLLSSVVFSSFAVGGNGLLYLFSCLMSCCLGNVLFEPYPISNTIVLDNWERIVHLFSLRMIQVSSCNTINNL